MRLLDRLLRPTVARLVMERIEEERLDALYRYRVHSGPARLRIHRPPSSIMRSSTPVVVISRGGVRVLRAQRLRFRRGARGRDKFGLDRQRAIPRSGYDIEIGEGAWLATNVLVAGPVKIGAHAVVGGGSVVRKDVEPCAVVAGSPARFIRYQTPPHAHRE
jgi:hypothetical protein